MGRQVRDARLETREARRRLKARADREPYWRLLREGLHLGYRIGARGGVWVARFRDGAGYTKRTLGQADDFEGADGRDTLSYAQAQARAHELAQGGKPPSRATVADATAHYLDWFRANKKSIASTEAAINAHILPAFGAKRVDEITRAQFKSWLQKLARTPARKRAKAGDAQQYRAAPTTDDEIRARRASANRILNVLKAILNHAVEFELVPDGGNWREVKAFKNADMPVVRFLTEAESTRLLNGCTLDLRDLVRAALLTGARYGELVALRVADVNVEAGNVYVAPSKSGKSRHVPLSTAGVEFFAGTTAGRAGPELVFTKANGSAWGKNHHVRMLDEACERARIDPAITFHELRHTYASLLAQAGADLLTISKLLGHADTRITSRHYAHLCDKTLANAVRALLPGFGHGAAAKVRAIR